MKKLLIALMTTTAALSLAATAEAADKLKACWVYTGPIGDFGYSYQHDQGRLEVEKALGDKVETAYLENVSEGPDADRAFERLAREGCKIIFGTCSARSPPRNRRLALPATSFPSPFPKW